jgi:hypothetical protein
MRLKETKQRSNENSKTKIGTASDILRLGKLGNVFRDSVGENSLQKNGRD